MDIIPWMIYTGISPIERYVPAYRWSRRWKTTSLWGDKRKAEPRMENIGLDCKIEKDFNFLNRMIRWYLSSKEEKSSNKRGSKN